MRRADIFCCILLQAPSTLFLFFCFFEGSQLFCRGKCRHTETQTNTAPPKGDIHSDTLRACMCINMSLQIRLQVCVIFFFLREWSTEKYTKCQPKQEIVETQAMSSSHILSMKGVWFSHLKRHKPTFNGVKLQQITHTCIWLEMEKCE